MRCRQNTWRNRLGWTSCRVLREPVSRSVLTGRIGGVLFTMTAKHCAKSNHNDRRAFGTKRPQRLRLNGRRSEASDTTTTTQYCAVSGRGARLAHNKVNKTSKATFRRIQTIGLRLSLCHAVRWRYCPFFPTSIDRAKFGLILQPRRANSTLLYRMARLTPHIQ
ncbi:hypothetical protein BR93DRAFT_531565 [Coniochaeta sp. PMI_546]|nr:hypothetical protein BR93DRAFT_531565 [Coniochaeta sp. PMI_546]